jgi:hypothetical protein
MPPVEISPARNIIINKVPPEHFDFWRDLALPQLLPSRIIGIV